jgi:hypothetical protein
MKDNRPTIKQIISKADSLGGTPMSEEEAKAWFERTCRENEADNDTWYDNFEDGQRRGGF